MKTLIFLISLLVLITNARAKPTDLDCHRTTISLGINTIYNSNKEFDVFDEKLDWILYKPGDVFFSIPLNVKCEGIYWVKYSYMGVDTVNIGTRTKDWQVPVGENIPFLKWKNNVHAMAIPIYLNPQRDTLFLQVSESHTRLQFSLEIFSEQQFLKHLEKNSLFDGFVVGILVLNLLLGILLLILEKKKYLVWFIIYQMSIAMFLLSQNNHAYPIFWPNSPSISQWHGAFFSIMAISSSCLFILFLLETEIKASNYIVKIKILLFILIGIAFSVMLFSKVHDFFYDGFLIEIIEISLFLCVNAWVVFNAIKKKSIARYVLLCSSPMILGFIIGISTEVLGQSWLFNNRGYIVELCITMEISLFSAFLAIKLRFERMGLMAIEKSFNQKLMVLNEKNRQLLALDLHDGIGQQFVGLKLLLHSLKKPEDCELNRKIDSSLAVLKNEIRELSNSIYPAFIEQNSASGFLNSLLDFFRKTFDQIDFIMDANVQYFENNIPIPLRIQFFRIVQEFVSNTINHSSCCWIKLIITKKTIVLMNDNSNSNNYGPLGLGEYSIYTRAKILNAEVHFELNENNEYMMLLTFNKN